MRAASCCGIANYQQTGMLEQNFFFAFSVTQKILLTLLFVKMTNYELRQMTIYFMTSDSGRKLVTKKVGAKGQPDLINHFIKILTDLTKPSYYP